MGTAEQKLRLLPARGEPEVALWSLNSEPLFLSLGLNRSNSPILRAAKTEALGAVVPYVIMLFFVVGKVIVSDCRQWGPLVKAVAVPSTRASFGPRVTPALLTGMRDVTFRQASPPGASSQGDHRYY